MAFVYRTLDKQNSPTTQIPGPGAYFNHKKNLQSHQPQHRAPFNHSENRQIWKTPILPGPGAYDTQTIIKKQKKLVADPLGQVVIYETPSQSVAFKSKTIRFVGNANSANPGPGQYETDPEVIRPLSAFKRAKNPSSQLKQFLKHKNNPFKTTDDQDYQLKDMVIAASDDAFQDSCMAPMDNAIENKKEQKNSLFFTSKVSRQINMPRPQTSAGPGSYNIAKSSFSVEKTYYNKSPVKSICIDKRVEKVQIQEVGPGYYELDQAFKNLNQSNLVKKKKIECFGSTVDRFQTWKADSHLVNPGPAAYSLLSQSTHKIKISKTHGTFPKEQRQVFKPRQSAVLPISYNTIQESFSVKRQKFKRNPSAKECFGSTKQRFSEKINDKVQFTNSCINQNVNLIVRKPKYNENEATKASQVKLYKTLLNTRHKKKRFQLSISTSQPKIEPKPIIDRPLCYDSESHTFGSKYGQKVQKEAPFMSCAQRFRDQNNQKFIELDFGDGKNSKKGTGEKSPSEKMTKRMSKKRDTKGKVGWMAVSKDERFKYKTEKQMVGPQYYEQVLPEKRSYNILFSQGK